MTASLALTAERGYTVPAAGGTYNPRVVAVDGVRQCGRDRRTARQGDDGARSDTRRTWAMRRDLARAAERAMKGVGQ